LVSLALITKVLRTRSGEEEKRSKNKNSKNTSKNSLSSHYLLGVEMGLGEALILFDLCLVLIVLALVLNVKSEKLGYLEMWWLRGICSPNHQSGHWGGCLSMGALDTVRCARHVTQPLGFDRWSSDRWDQRIVRWCIGRYCSLSSAPSDAALTLRALSAHCAPVSRPLKSTVALGSCCSAGTPDSPVNYSEVAFPET
jgi:hypothetical protein